MSNLEGYIVSFSHSDGYAMFYKPDSSGYTYDLNEAGVYSLKEGLEIEKSTHGEVVWVSVFDIYEKVKKMVRTAHIKKLNEEELFAAKLYDFLLKTELSGDFTNCYSWCGEPDYYGYEIVDKPLGDKQEFEYEALDENRNPIDRPEEFKYIDHEYCHQIVNGGITGDDYSGYLYYPLPSGKYIKCHYVCK